MKSLPRILILSALFCTATLPASVAQVGGTALQPGREECPETDLHKAPDSPFRKVPVEDQNGAGICYAVFAGTMANYWHVKNGGDPSQGFHSAYLASVYSRSKGRDDVSGGTGADTLEALSSAGNCPKQKVNELLQRWGSYGLTYSELLAFIESANQPSLEKRKLKTQELTEYLLAGRTRVLEADPASAQVSCVLQKGATDFLSRLPHFRANQLLKDLFDACTPLQALPSFPEPVFRSEGQDSEIADSLSLALRSGSPGGIGICSAALDDPSFEGVGADPERTIRNREKCGPHAVMVSGIKSFQGECRYLIRNSWGSDWRAKGRECACYRRDGTYEETCSDFSEAKEVVGCWFPKKTILRNTYSVTTLP